MVGEMMTWGRLLLMIMMICRHGAADLQLRTAVPTLASLVGDPNSAVRDAAMQLLVDVYRHVGK